jgi:hypothetical protein
MRLLTYFVACSVDGFIAHTDRSHDGFSKTVAISQNYLPLFLKPFPPICVT